MLEKDLFLTITAPGSDFCAYRGVYFSTLRGFHTSVLVLGLNFVQKQKYDRLKNESPDTKYSWWNFGIQFWIHSAHIDGRSYIVTTISYFFLFENWIFDEELGYYSLLAFGRKGWGRDTLSSRFRSFVVKYYYTYV